VGAWLFGITPLPDILQAPILAALPGPVFGFLIDNLQHAGKVAEETGLVLAIVALGATVGIAVTIMPRNEAAHLEATDPSRRRILQLAPLLVGGAALAVVGARLVPAWYQAMRPPEGGAGEIPPITPASSFYIVSKNFRDPIVVLDGWNLRVHGLVDRELQLGHDHLAAMQQASEIVTLECVSNPVGGRLMSTGRFEGPRLVDVISRAGPEPAARHVAFRANDGYRESIPLNELRPEMLVALMLNGSPLPNEHGFPARILIPGRYGMKGPKWLESIELLEGAPGGYWEAKGWNANALVKTTSRIDLPADGATVTGPAITVAGVAFAGLRGISRVELSDNAGTTWRAADLDPPISQFTWRIWRASWQPRRDPFTLMVRATDGSGAIQDARLANSFPDGSSGLHTIRVTVGS
jgi:DMSO/TMAO reductase YedYZ molybdopterin-dependent catalytic subunit